MGRPIGKSLKDQNRWPLWLVMAANVAVLYAVLRGEAPTALGLKALFGTASSFIPVGLAAVVTTIANGILSADDKARLVFLRWKHALPGHRAFSEYALCDPRIDIAALEKACGGKCPSDPVEQNRTWYRLFKTIEDNPAVAPAHRDFLLTRDYTSFAMLFLVVFGATALVLGPSWRASLIYGLGLVAQFLLVRHVASIYGVRFVKTVLARKAATAQ
jgi:hypothetical protein